MSGCLIYGHGHIRIRGFHSDLEGRQLAQHLPLGSGGDQCLASPGFTPAHSSVEVMRVLGIGPVPVLPALQLNLGHAAKSAVKRAAQAPMCRRRDPRGCDRDAAAAHHQRCRKRGYFVRAALSDRPPFRALAADHPDRQQETHR